MEPKTNRTPLISETIFPVSEPEKFTFPAPSHSANVWSYLAQVTKALAANLTPRQIAETVVRLCISALEARGGILVRLPMGEHHLELLYASGYSSEVIESWQEMSLHAPTIIAATIRQKEPFFLSSRSEAEAQGLSVGPISSVGNAFAALPLIAAGRVVGGIGFSFSAPRTFAEEEKAFLSSVAQMAALAVHVASEEESKERFLQRNGDKALRAREAQLRFLANIAPVQIAHVGADERYLFINRIYADFHRVEPEHVVGKHPREILGDEVYAAIAPYMQRALAGEDLQYEALLKLSPDGPRYYRIQYASDRADNGTVRGYVATIQDIHDQKMAAERIQAALQEKEDTLARLNTLVMAAPLGIAFFDCEMRYVLINDPLAEMNGISAEEHIGRTILEIVPDLYPTVAPIFRQVVERGTSFLNMEVSGETPKAPGVQRYWLESWYPVHSNSGTVAGVGVIVTEITDQKRQQGEIAALNGRLRQAMTETHHRVKNNLQVIAAMIDLQTLSGRDHLPRTEFQRLGLHVRTLANVHDILTEHAKMDGTAGTVSAKAVLGKLLTMLESINQDYRLRYTLEDGQVTSRQATSLSIIANELTSNAIKHGNSTVDITFSVKDGSAVLIVEDDGPGFPDGFNPIQASNTGLELVLNLADWDMKGEIRFENRESGGGRAILTFPLTLASA